MLKVGLLIALCACTAFPQPYEMNIRLKGGPVVSIPIADIQKLTFSGRLSNIGNEKLATIIRTFGLFQNYPNPFNPSTTIEYELPKPGDVEVRIFNVNGQLVRSFSALSRTSGLHATTWDGKNTSGEVVASGMYIYQVVFDKSVLTKKMLFLK